MSKSISRRGFLKGLTAGALGYSAAAMLGPIAVVKAEETISGGEIDWTDAADMIVVGGGGAGFCAAIEAARAGSSVLILEKSGLCGGDTLLSGGMIMVGGCDEQEAMGIKDSVENFVKTELGYAGEYADHEMIREMCEHSNEQLQFMKSIGRKYSTVMPMNPVYGYDDLDTWAPRTIWQGREATTGHFAALQETVNQMNNVKVRTGKEIAHLITDKQGMVIGVEDVNGAAYRANKGVVLATASFGRNMEMSRNYNPMNYWALRYEETFDKPCPNGQAVKNTGDGIRMAQEIGADLALSPANCINDCCAIGMTSMYGAILLNNNGMRFVQENAHWGYLNTAVYQETIRCNANDYSKLYFWLIADKNAAENNLYLNANINGVVRTGTANYHKLIVKADTLKELAEKTGMPVQNVKYSADRWNEMVAKGEDTDFHRKDVNGSHDLVEFGKGPYYAFPYIPYSMGAFGGVRTNRETQIINVEGNPIPRLYAAGTVMSGMFTGAFYNACGWAILGTVHWGRKAGANIAKLEPWTTEAVQVKKEHKASVEDAIANAKGNYKPGVYTAVGKGRNGDVPVTVEFSETAIIKITVGEHMETPGLGDAAITGLPERILLAQNVDVDNVSGATVTSEAIREAVRDCIKMASK